MASIENKLRTERFKQAYDRLVAKQGSYKTEKKLLKLVRLMKERFTNEDRFVECVWFHICLEQETKLFGKNKLSLKKMAAAHLVLREKRG